MGVRAETNQTVQANGGYEHGDKIVPTLPVTSAKHHMLDGGNFYEMPTVTLHIGHKENPTKRGDHLPYFFINVWVWVQIKVRARVGIKI